MKKKKTKNEDGIEKPIMEKSATPNRREESKEALAPQHQERSMKQEFVGRYVFLFFLIWLFPDGDDEYQISVPPTLHNKDDAIGKNNLRLERRDLLDSH